MKKLITLLLVLVMALSLAACGGSQTAETSEEPEETEESTEAVETTEETEEENDGDEIEYDEPIVIMDNEYCKMAVTSKFGNNVNTNWNNEKCTFEGGYRLLVENKDTDKYLQFFPDNIVVGDFSLAYSDYPNFSLNELSPGTKGVITITFFDHDTASVRFKSIDDLKNINIMWNLEFSDDSVDWFAYDSVYVKSGEMLP